MDKSFWSQKLKQISQELRISTGIAANYEKMTQSLVAAGACKWLFADSPLAPTGAEPPAGKWQMSLPNLKKLTVNSDSPKLVNSEQRFPNNLGTVNTDSPITWELWTVKSDSQITWEQWTVNSEKKYLAKSLLIQKFCACHSEQWKVLLLDFLHLLFCPQFYSPVFPSAPSPKKPTALVLWLCFLNFLQLKFGPQH